jgi:hypothetical protein
VLGRLENVRGRPLSRAHDGVERLRGGRETALLEVRGLDGRDLAFGTGDRLGHFHEIEADAIHVLDRALVRDRLLEAADRLEQNLGIGRAVALREFGQEPAAARRLHDGRLDRLVFRLRDRRQRSTLAHEVGPPNLSCFSRHGRMPGCIW